VKKILVVGQGIAGTILAWTLRRKGARVDLADTGVAENSSTVAAGVINPVTGKRYVKSWRFDELYPAAMETYRHLETTLDIQVWYDFPILRLLSSTEEVNNWAARASQPDYVDLMEIGDSPGLWAPFIPSGLHYGFVQKSARVDFSAILQAVRNLAVSEGWFLPGKISYSEAEKLSSSYDHIIFAEGYRAKENPFFPNLGWQLAKGEALFIRFGDNRANEIRHMLKKSMILAPLGNGLFWAGGSYNWTYDDELPTEGERNYILNGLHDMIAVPFTIVGHKAAVRPTVKDRRPFLGLSAESPSIGIFNGMGTKGALLTPFWAAHFAAHLLEGLPLDPEVDIRRFR
jgi:glycine/D-amino acid oxidase-like deaminating enzyme